MCSPVATDRDDRVEAHGRPREIEGMARPSGQLDIAVSDAVDDALDRWNELARLSVAGSGIDD
jgi:hypothetical protein